MSSITAWICGNETLLSGVAAIVVVLSFVASPLGAGLRGLVRRWAGVVDGAVAAQAVILPAADIPSPPEADRPSVAVLPFSPASKDEESEIPADGMTDDVISLLARVPGFFVISRGSAFAYKGQSLDARHLAVLKGASLHDPHACFTSQSGHRCQSPALPLSTRSGRRWLNVPSDKIGKHGVT